MVKCSKAEMRRLKAALRWKISAAQRQRIQMVLLRECGLPQPAIAVVMGVSLSTVNRAHSDPLHRAQSQTRPLHHFLSLYRQLTLMWNCYQYLGLYVLSSRSLLERAGALAS